MYRIVSIILAANLFLVFGQASEKKLKNELSVVQQKSNEDVGVQTLDQSFKETFTTGRLENFGSSAPVYNKQQKLQKKILQTFYLLYATTRKNFMLQEEFQVVS